MKKFILLLLFISTLFSCSSDDNVDIKMNVRYDSVKNIITINNNRSYESQKYGLSYDTPVYFVLTNDNKLLIKTYTEITDISVSGIYGLDDKLNISIPYIEVYSDPNFHGTESYKNLILDYHSNEAKYFYFDISIK